MTRNGESCFVDHSCGIAWEKQSDCVMQSPAEMESVQDMHRELA